MSRFKTIHLLTASVLLSISLEADTTNFGLIGGYGYTGGTTVPFGIVTSSTGVLTNLHIANYLLPETAEIVRVAINGAGAGILAGNYDSGIPVAFLLSPTGAVTNLDLSYLGDGIIYSAAINQFGTGLLGGQSSTGSDFPFAFLVSPSGNITNIPIDSLVPTNATVQSTAINDFGLGLIGLINGGSSTKTAFFVSSTGALTPIDLTSPDIVAANGVAINNSGLGLVGGANGSNGAAAAFVLPTGQVTSLNFSPAIGSGIINSVSINQFGTALLGGEDDTPNPNALPIAYLASPNGEVQTLIFPNTISLGVVKSVSINNLGTGLIGAQSKPSEETGHVYAFFVSPSGALTNIDLTSFGTNAVLEDVAINDFGVGLIGGSDSGAPFAALISPTGQVQNLHISSLFAAPGATNGIGLSVLTQISTGGLSGNNLIVANYINGNAPYDTFYFVPATFDVTLNQALESAAPTRNAISVFAADNNLFFLNQGLSLHSRDSRQLRHTRRQLLDLRTNNKNTSLSTQDLFEEEDQLIASSKSSPQFYIKTQGNSPYAIWGQLVGALSYQKAQNQTPGFRPWTGGAIFAFCAQGSDSIQPGVGAAYTYTHIHETQGAGHSHINQEYLFGYLLCDKNDFYLDLALWGGLFQTDQVRIIEMTGFNFEAKSTPRGWQLAPHLELGYDIYPRSWFILEPFAMFDWVSNWQNHYREHGTGPFNFAQDRHYSSFLRSEVGLRFYERISFNFWRLVLQEDVGYVNKNPFEVGTFTGFLVGSPGSLTVETLTSMQNLVTFEMQFIFEPTDPRFPYGTIDYKGEYCPSYQSHQASLNISWSF